MQIRNSRGFSLSSFSHNTLLNDGISSFNMGYFYPRPGINVKFLKMKNVKVALMAFMLLGSLAACTEDTPKEEVKTEEQPVVNETQAAIDTAKDKIGDAVEATADAGAKVAEEAVEQGKEAAGKMKEATKDAVEKGAEKVENAAREVKEEVKK